MRGEVKGTYIPYGTFRRTARDGDIIGCCSILRVLADPESVVVRSAKKYIPFTDAQTAMMGREPVESAFCHFVFGHAFLNTPYILMEIGWGGMPAAQFIQKRENLNPAFFHSAAYLVMDAMRRFRSVCWGWFG